MITGDFFDNYEKYSRDQGQRNESVVKNLVRKSRQKQNRN
jgi:hypothetical protein